MEERRKILELIAEGKLTAEQADLLLDALEQQGREKPDGKVAWDKATAEMKTFGSQMSSVIAQGMSDLRRGIETNLVNMQFGDFIATSFEQEFPEHIRSLHVESVNGKIRVERWTQPNIRMYVQADVRMDEQMQAKELLEKAVRTNVTGEQVAVELLSRVEGARVNGVRIDLYIPDSLQSLSLKTRNGAIFIDHVEAVHATMETVNGQIRADHVRAKHLRLMTQNGAINLVDVLSDDTDELYAESRNGAILLRGIPSKSAIQGQAKTVNGNVHIAHPSLTTTYETETRRNQCTFERSAVDTDITQEISVYLETKNGKISVQ